MGMTPKEWIGQLDDSVNIEGTTLGEYILFAEDSLRGKNLGIQMNYCIALLALHYKDSTSGSQIASEITEGSFNGIATTGAVSSISEGKVAISFGGGSAKEQSTPNALKSTRWGMMLWEILNRKNIYIGVTGTGAV
ncbi:DUF4054 domain-containing protein [Treponema sp. R6D11]